MSFKLVGKKDLETGAVASATLKFVGEEADLLKAAAKTQDLSVTDACYQMVRWCLKEIKSAEAPKK